MTTALEPRGIHRRITFTINESLRVRLLRSIQTGEPDACWNWTGAQRNGYGAIKSEGKVLGTHVVAYVLENGELPEGCIVTHACDNRLCCNPKHLVAGTATTNNRELWDRRPQAARKGAAAWNAVLNDDRVRQIHAFRIALGMTPREIAGELQLSVEAVKGVINRGRWPHVPRPSEQEAKEIVNTVRGAAAEFAELIRSGRKRVGK